jgi:hypothetical protein
MSGSDVINRRQNRTDTASFLKLKMDLKLTPAEERSIRGATNLSHLMDSLRKFSNQPVEAGGKGAHHG